MTAVKQNVCLFLLQVGTKNYSLSNYWPFIDDSETQCSTSGQVSS